MTACQSPLVVDLDGTLLRSDLLYETSMAYARGKPLQLLKPFAWLSKGKAALKGGLAEATQIDVSVLPYNAQVIELIESQRLTGRRIILATASHYTLAEKISEHLQLFDQVLASDGKCNLSAHKKRDVLVECFGEKGFDYVGNSQDDVSVWAVAQREYVVNPDAGV